MTVVNTNVGALTAQAAMVKNNRNLETAVERLSTGLRINSAADDAAGMAISQRLESQVLGLNQAIRNATDGQALLDTAEGAQNEVVNLLQRLRQLAVQSSNDTNSAIDRLYIEKEADQILAEVNRISDQTRWNGMKLLDGTFDSVQFQLGANRAEDVDLSIRSIAANDVGTHRVEGTASHLAGVADSIDSHNLTVAGHVGSKVLTVAANASAKTVAATVNQNTELTGVSATAVTKAEIAKLHATGNVGFTIGNGTDSATITTTNIASVSDLTDLRDAINDKSGTTKITADIVNNDKSRIILTHATGEDIIISGISAGIMTVRSLGADETDTNSMGSTDTTAMMVIGTRAAAAASLSTAVQTAASGTVATIATTTHVGSKITLTSASDDSTKTATITGLNLDGETITESLNMANGAATSANQYASIISIVASEQSAGTLSVGVAAQDSTAGATFVGHMQFDSVRSFSVTSSAGTNASDNFTGGGTTADASTFLNVGTVDLATVSNSEKALSIIDGALSMVDLSRAEQGALSNRLDNTVSNLTNVVLNTESSQSSIQDADFAKESSALTKAQILAQASTSMLAQANASKQTILALLQN
tara:strand:- start:2025 stop:3812 length:1788 start_codon:yes stop_codon:yes gene_type:complete